MVNSVVSILQKGAACSLVLMGFSARCSFTVHSWTCKTGKGSCVEPTEGSSMYTDSGTLVVVHLSALMGALLRTKPAMETVEKHAAESQCACGPVRVLKAVVSNLQGKAARSCRVLCASYHVVCCVRHGMLLCTSWHVVVCVMTC